MFSSVCFVLWPHLIPKSWPAYYNYDARSPALGASGAVNAVIMWSVCSFPRNMIYLYGIVPIPAAIAGLGFVGMDAYALYSGSTSGVGNSAHLGGAAFGLAFFGLIKKYPRIFRRY
jgi:membrane associated rhomboid family serine protease